MTDAQHSYRVQTKYARFIKTQHTTNDYEKQIFLDGKSFISSTDRKHKICFSAMCTINPMPDNYDEAKNMTCFNLHYCKQ